MFRMATVISDEARAKHHEYIRARQPPALPGAHVLVAEHQHLPRSALGPRPGDVRRRSVPHRHGSASQFIRGLQGDDPKYFKTVATVKHFAVHSGPEPERHTFDAVVSERDLRETLPAALRDGHSRRRRVLADVRLQPRRRQSRRAAATCCSRTSCAASGGSRATSSPTAARSTTSTCATRSSPTAAGGRRARA